MTVNDFVKSLKQISPDCEYRAEKDGVVFKSRGWEKEFEDGDKKQITPHVAKKVEVKRGRKA